MPTADRGQEGQEHSPTAPRPATARNQSATTTAPKRRDARRQGAGREDRPTRREAKILHRIGCGALLVTIRASRISGSCKVAAALRLLPVLTTVPDEEISWQ
jgi:hypothetical protein